MAASDHVPPAFTTPLGTRAMSVIFAVCVGSGSALIAIFAGGVTCYLAWLSGAPWAIAALPGLLVWAFFLRLTWNIVIAPLRFRIAFQGDTVRLGSGWLACRFYCTEVEVISLPDHPSEHGVGLEGGGRGAFVFLTETDETKCVALLLQRCINALYVDRYGNEQLPVNSDRPLVPISALYRRCRSLAWGAFAAAGFFGTMALGRGLGICTMCFGHRQGVPFEQFLFACIEFPVFVVGTIGAAVVARRNWLKAATIRQLVAETFPPPTG